MTTLKYVISKIVLIFRADHGALNINGRNTAQTVGSFGRNVFGTDLVGIQAQHSQLGEVSHVDGVATETAQSKV